MKLKNTGSFTQIETNDALFVRMALSTQVWGKINLPNCLTVMVNFFLFVFLNSEVRSLHKNTENSSDTRFLKIKILLIISIVQYHIPYTTNDSPYSPT